MPPVFTEPAPVIFKGGRLCEYRDNPRMGYSIMTFTRGNLGFFLAFIIIGGILGSAIGTLLAKLFPVLSVIKSNLTGPIGFSIEIISFNIRLNPAAIVGCIASIFIFRKV